MKRGEKTATIIKLVKEGKTNKEICAKLGIHRGSVSGVIFRAKKSGHLPNVDNRKGPISKPMIAEKKRAYTKQQPTITQVEMTDNDNFIIIVGKGTEMLTKILNNVRMS